MINHNLTEFLGRLSKLKQTKPDSWSACCPAHDDKSPSLAIKSLDDGRILVNCFGGCGAIDIVLAVGMTLESLMPLRDENWKPSKSESRHWAAKQVLESLQLELAVVAVAARTMKNGHILSGADYQRLELAYERITDGATYAK